MILLEKIFLRFKDFANGLDISDIKEVRPMTSDDFIL